MRVIRLATRQRAVPEEPGRPEQCGCSFLSGNLSIPYVASKWAAHEGISRTRSEVSVPTDLTKVSATRLVAQHPRTVVTANSLFKTIGRPGANSRELWER